MKNGFWRYSFNLLRATVFILVFIALTSFGWNFFPRFNQKQADFHQTSENLKATVRHLSEDIGVRNYVSFDHLEKAAQYIESSFVKVGYSVESWNYVADGQTFRNIVAKYKNNDSEDYILIGAHYDSCFTPGADDNASGVAGLLELARSLKSVPLKSNILFVAFTNEEPPFFRTPLMGSRVFVSAAQKKHINIRGAVILEMIGFYSDKWFSQRYLPLLGPFYPNKGDFITLVGNFKSRHLVNAVQNDFNKQKYVLAESIVAPDEIPGINFSDHASFWAVGIPAIMITDTAFLRNVSYHRSADTIDKIDFGKMAAVVESLKSAVVNLTER